MLGKILRAMAITAVATAGAAWVLVRLDSSGVRATDAVRGSAEPGGDDHEIDSDKLSPAERDAMLAELEAQL